LIIAPSWEFPNWIHLIVVVAVVADAIAVAGPDVIGFVDVAVDSAVDALVIVDDVVK
jgi:hypothetical protein